MGTNKHETREQLLDRLWVEPPRLSRVVEIAAKPRIYFARGFWRLREADRSRSKNARQRDYPARNLCYEFIDKLNRKLHEQQHACPRVVE